MGLFSGKYRYFAYASTTSLVKEKDYPRTLRNAVTEAIRQGFDVVDSVMAAREDSFANAVRKMARYSERKHPAGLPTATINNQELHFLPISLLMHDKQYFDDYDEDDNEAAEFADATRKQLDMLGMDADQFMEDFREEEEKSAEGGAEKWDVALHFALPGNTSSQAGQRYIFRFMEYLQQYQRAGLNQEYIDWTHAPTGIDNQPWEHLIIKEGEDTGFHLEFGWSYLDQRKLDAVRAQDRWFDGALRISSSFATQPRYYKCDVGEYMTIGVSRVMGLRNVWRGWLLRWFGEQEGQRMFEAISDQNHLSRDDSSFLDVYVVAHRISEYEYDVMFSLGLSEAYKINIKENAQTEGDYRYAEFTPKYQWDGEPNITADDQFRFPLAVEVINQFGFNEREKLLAESFSATVLLVQVTYQRWYQQSFWGWTFLIVAAVLLAYGQAWIAKLVGYLGPVIGTTAAKFVATAVVSMATSTAINLALQGLPLGLAELLGLFLIIYTVVTLDWSQFSLKGLQGMTFNDAIGYLNSVLSIVEQGYNYYLEKKYQSLQAEMEDFLKSAKEKQEELEAAYDKEFSSTGIDPMRMIERNLVQAPVESPDEFYSRVLDTNPAIKSLDVIHNYYDIALNLPDALGKSNIVDTVYQQFTDLRFRNV